MSAVLGTLRHACGQVKAVILLTESCNKPHLGALMQCSRSPYVHHQLCKCGFWVPPAGHQPVARLWLGGADDLPAGCGNLCCGCG